MADDLDGIDFDFGDDQQDPNNSNTTKTTESETPEAVTTHAEDADGGFVGLEDLPDEPLVVGSMIPQDNDSDSDTSSSDDDDNDSDDAKPTIEQSANGDDDEVAMLKRPPPKDFDDHVDDFRGSSLSKKKRDDDFDDDEFEDVWAQPEPQKETAAGNASSNGVSKPGKKPRKRLKASTKQKTLEKKQKQEAQKPAVIPATISEPSSGVDKPSEEPEADTTIATEATPSMQSDLLEKLGLGPAQVEFVKDEVELHKVERQEDDKAAAEKSEKDTERENQTNIIKPAVESPQQSHNGDGGSDLTHRVEPSETEAAAADEWDQVTHLRDQQIDQAPTASSGAGGMGFAKQRSSPISFREALAILLPQALAQHRKSIVRYDMRQVGCWAGFAYKIFGPPTLSQALSDERDAVFALAKQQLDLAALFGGDESQTETDCRLARDRVVVSIFMKLTGDMLPPPQTGSHWEVIGFQGKDPATDLRGSGMLGLLQLIDFLVDFPGLAARIFQLSRNDEQEFPFCVVSLNITGMVLSIFRECSLYGQAKSKQSVFAVVNELYKALFYRFYLIWKNEHKRIFDFDSVKKRVLAEGRSNALDLIQRFKADNQTDASSNDLEFAVIP